MRKKLSKRGKLYLANGIAFIVLIDFLILLTLLSHVGLQVEWVLIFLLIQCAFTFMTLIVYYLSIIADAVNKNYKEQEDKDKNKK